MGSRVNNSANATALDVASTGHSILGIVDDCYPLKSEEPTIEFDELLVEPKPVYEGCKRAFDVTASVAALVVLSPALLLVALIIFIDDPHGSPIYTQMRVGKNERVFKFYKFRSMIVDADDLKASLCHKNEVSAPAFKIQEDPRTTTIGKFIRKTSIDELPQLWNVIKGDMSIVGPRPLVVDEINSCDAHQKQRLKVEQGLTCYWQCGGRSKIGFLDWMEMDLKYVQERGMWTDVKIIVRTFGAVIRADGAH